MIKIVKKRVVEQVVRVAHRVERVLGKVDIKAYTIRSVKIWTAT